LQLITILTGNIPLGYAKFMKALKKHKVPIILGVAALIVVCLVVFFIISSRSAQQSSQNQTSIDNSVQTLSPDAIGLKLEASPDKRKVRFIIAKASDISAIEYELTYDANSTAQERSEGSLARVQRGITGQLNVKQGSGTYTSSWLILGSQSANIVRYDTGVKSVSITLKITKSNNKVYQVQDSLNL
jgi:hypothetical protein